MVRTNCGRLGSLVKTVARLVIVRPPKPAVLILMVMVPSVPGGISSVGTGDVHPQLVFISSIVSVALPSLITRKALVT